MLPIEQTSEGTMCVGATLCEVRKFLSRRVESTAEVTQYEPNRRVAFKSTSGPIAYEWGATLESINGSTKVMFSGQADPGGFFTLGEPIVMPAFKRQQDADLADLKELVESEAWGSA